MAAGSTTIEREGNAYWVVHPTPGGVQRYLCQSEQQAVQLCALLTKPPQAPRQRQLVIRARPGLVSRVSRALKRRRGGN